MSSILAVVFSAQNFMSYNDDPKWTYNKISRLMDTLMSVPFVLLFVLCHCKEFAILYCRWWKAPVCAFWIVCYCTLSSWLKLISLSDNWLRIQYSLYNTLFLFYLMFQLHRCQLSKCWNCCSSVWVRNYPVFICLCSSWNMCCTIWKFSNYV